MLTPWKESYDKPRQHIEKQRHYFVNEGPSSKGYGFFSGHVWMWELDCEESRAPNNWCFWTVVLEKTLERPLNFKEVQPVHPKGDQPWVFIGRTDAKAEIPVLSPPDEKNWLIGKHPDAGRDWGKEERGMTEYEVVGWHHQFNGHGFGWTPGVRDGQGGLACCGSWDCKEFDMTEWLKWTETWFNNNEKHSSLFRLYYKTINLSSVQFSPIALSSPLDCSMPGLPVPHFLSICPNKFMSIDSMMPSKHPFLCHSYLLLPSIFPSMRIPANESTICIKWPKHWSLSFITSLSTDTIL